MLTSGELALLSPVFGFVGVIAGGLITWLSTDRAARRQQQISANRAQLERRAAVYEDMLVELNRMQREQEARINAGPQAARPDYDAEADARWRARVAIHGSELVREAYISWSDVMLARWKVVPLANVRGEQNPAFQAWLSQLSETLLAVSRAMREDLDALATVPRAQSWRSPGQ